MKVLLVNKFHYIKGGSETYYFGLAELLKKNGHDVIYFSMKDKKNFPCEQEKYFVENVDFNQKMNVFKIIKSSAKMLYSFEAQKKFKQLLIDEKPDIIHFNIFQSQLTSSIVDIAYKLKIPMVYTAHDLKSICPNYQMLNHENVCEKCLKGNYTNCFKTSCMKDSKLKSLLATIEAYVYKFRKTYSKFDLIITPSNFYKQKIEQAKIAKCDVIHMTNFLSKSEKNIKNVKGNYFLFFGRLSREKGIITLIEAYEKTDKKHKLYIVGNGPIKGEINAFIEKNNLSDNVKLLGFKSGDELKNIIINSLCVVLPSEWYENGPYTIMEAMDLGKPVIVSSYGGLIEMVDNGVNGYVVEAQNSNDLAQKLNHMSVLDNKSYNDMQLAAKNKAEKLFSGYKYTSELLEKYRAIIKE